MFRPWSSLRRFWNLPTRPRTIVRRQPTRQRLRLEELESRLAPTVNLLNNFDAQNYNNGGGYVPPDTTGAAGPNSYLETVNASVAIYNKSTNATIASDSISDFLFTKGGLSSSWGIYDTTSVYDQPIGRFVVGELGLNGNSSALNIAVSKTSNPTTLDGNSWNFYTINTSEANETADYPGNLGYNADSFVYTFNMFPTNSNGTYHAQIVDLTQSSLASGSPGGYFYDANHWSMRPVTMHDSTSGGPMWFVEEAGYGGGNNYIVLSRYENLNSGSTSWQDFNIGVNPYGSVNAPLNPNGTAITTNIDSKIQKAAESNNDIVATQAVGVGSNEDDARWYEINVSNINSPYLVQQGNVGFGANTYTVYPAIDINQDGDIGLDFTKSGDDYSTDYMSTYITGWRNGTDAYGSMESPVLVRSGNSNNTDGREGDLSGINVDPIDGTFWGADEYTAGGIWGTEVSNFALNANMSVNSGQLGIFGDQLGPNYNDYVRLDTNGYGGVTAILDGEANVYGYGAITSVYIDPGGGSNTIQINNVPANCGVDITGNGANFVTIGNGYDGVQGINSGVFVYNGYPTPSSTGYTNLTIDDRADTGGRNATLYDQPYGDGQQTGYILGLAPATIQWFDNSSGTYTGGVYELSIYGGSGVNTFTVTNTGKLYGGTYLNSGNSYNAVANTVNVEGVTTSSSLTVDGGSGFLNVYVGSNGSGGGGTLANIAGSVFVENSSTSGSSSLVVDDGGDSTGRTWNLNFDSISSTGLPGSISWNTYGPSFGGVTYLRVLGGSGFNTMNVNATGSGPYSYFTDVYTGTGGATVNVYNTLGNMDVINEGGLDDVYVGSAGSALNGSMATINGFVDVYGAGHTYLWLGDSADTTSRTVNMYDGELTGLSAGNIYWTPSSGSSGGVIEMFVLGSGGGSTYTVNNTSNLAYGTYLETGGGNDTVNVLATQGELYDYNGGGQDSTNIGLGNMGSINGSVDVYGAGSTSLYLNDSSDTSTRTVSMGYGYVTGLGAGAGTISWTPSASATGGVTYLEVDGGSGGHIYYVYNTDNLYSGILLNTGTGNDNVDIYATQGALSVYNPGGGDLTQIGFGSAATINGSVDVWGASGSSTSLVVNDNNDSTSRTAVLTSSTLTGLGNAGTISYNPNVTSLTLDGGSGSDTWDLNSTAAATPVTVNAGNGANSFVLTSGSDLLSNLQGALTLNGGSGSNTLTVDDQNDSSNDTYTLATGSITSTNAAAITYSGVGSVTVNGSSTAATTYNVNSTASGTPLTVNAGSGANIVNLTPTSKNLNNLAGAVTVNAGSASTVNVDDQSNAVTAAYTVTASNVSRSGFGGLTYAGLGTLALNGGSKADTYSIPSTAAGSTVKVTGGVGNDVFTVGSGNNLNGIQGALTVTGGGGINTLNANDSSSGSGQAYTLSSAGLTRSGIATISYATLTALVTGGGNDTLTILSPVPTVATTFNGGSGTNTLVGANAANTWTISGANSGVLGKVTFSNFQNLTGGTSTDTFNFTTSTASVSGTLNGGAGSNTISYATLGSSYPVTVTLTSNTAGSATAIGGGFSNIGTVKGSTDTANTLTAPNSTNTWTISAANAGNVNTGPTAVFTFTGMPNLVGGTGVDTFKFSSTSGNVASINGGGAPAGKGDWLNYAAFPSTSTVTVNLATGSATNVSGTVTNIQNVLGSASGTNNLTGDSQGNILIGGSGSNTLIGGSGGSLLIGGSGSGSITGGSGSDILIAGTTTYSAATTAGQNSLMAILAELQSADTFAQKVYDLIHGSDSGDPNGQGSDKNGSNKLTWGVSGATVKASTGVFTLSGDSSASSAADWFFSNASSTVSDFNDDSVNDEHNNNALGTF